MVTFSFARKLLWIGCVGVIISGFVALAVQETFMLGVLYASLFGLPVLVFVSFAVTLYRRIKFKAELGPEEKREAKHLFAAQFLLLVFIVLMVYLLVVSIPSLFIF